MEAVMKGLPWILVASVSLSGCDSVPLSESRTLGEINTGYNYIPLDPLAVAIEVDPPLPANATAAQARERRYSRCVTRSKSTPPNPSDVMDALPDHTVRMAVRKVTGDGNLGFGPAAFSVSGNSYQVVVDSIFADTTNVRFGIRIAQSNRAQSVTTLAEDIPEGTAVSAVRLGPKDPLPAGHEEVYIPVYVGIGLRLTANLTARKGGMNLSNLGGIAASAQAEKISGSLTMQTLGIFNQQVAATFPIPSDLNSTAVQNALVSLGSVKAIVYDRDTGTRPRVTGIYNPLPTSDPKLINKIYAALARTPVEWVPCGSA
jgi:hypothetical protein